MKDLEEEIVEIITIVNEIKKIKEDNYKNGSINVLKEDYPDKIGKLEEALLN